MFDNLTNHGMLELMEHQFDRYNKLWLGWIFLYLAEMDQKMTNQDSEDKLEREMMTNSDSVSNCCGANDIYNGNLDNNEGVCADCGEHCEMEAVSENEKIREMLNDPEVIGKAVKGAIKAQRKMAGLESEEQYSDLAQLRYKLDRINLKLQEQLTEN